MPEPLDLFFSIVFSLIGIFYLKYGRSAGYHYTIAGVGLIGYMFFTETTAQLIWIGIALVITPFIINKFL